MSEQCKELGQRTAAELEALFGNMYSGWDRGVVVSQERFGTGETRFSERPMTDLELAARYVAAEIGVNIYEIAGRAAFAPIITFSQIQVHIGPVFDLLHDEIASLRAQLAKSCDDSRFGDTDVGCPRSAKADAEIASLRAKLEGCGGEVKTCKSDVPCGFGALAQIKSLRTKLESARKALEHAQVRFKCVADDANERGDEAGWAMASVDADIMTAALTDETGK